VTPSDPSAAETYPGAERQDIEEVIHGHLVADPYRWLEQPDAAATVAWSAAEDRLFASWAAGRAEREPLVRRLLALIPGYRGAPTVIGERRFWSERRPGQDHAVVWVSDPDGTRPLVDPNTIDPDGKVTLDGWSPSLEGDRLAYLLSSGGDEEARLTVIDVATSAVVDGPVDRLRYTDLAWLPGGEELLYVRRLPPDVVPAGEEMYHRRVWRHRLGTDPDGDVLVFGGDGHGPDVDATAYLGVDTSADGRRVAVTVSLGTAPRNDLYVAELPPPPVGGAGVAGGAPAAWTTVLRDVDAQAWPHWDRRGGLWIVTDLGAPRRRLVRADPDAPGPEGWVEIVAEDPDGGILESYVLTGGHLVVARSRHALSAVSVHDRIDGAWQRDVALPGPGSAGVHGRPDEGPGAWLGWTDYTAPSLRNRNRRRRCRPRPHPSPSGQDPRTQGPRTQDPRMQDPRMQDPRMRCAQVVRCPCRRRSTRRSWCTARPTAPRCA
jgi:prolyl oligopeptidase